MAAVINLDTIRLTRHIEETSPREPVSAEIILFPGIRYERWDDADSGEENSASNGAERDRVVLSQD